MIRFDNLFPRPSRYMIDVSYGYEGLLGLVVVDVGI